MARVDVHGRVWPHYAIGWALLALGLAVFGHLMLAQSGLLPSLIPQEKADEMSPWWYVLRFLGSVALVSCGHTLVNERRW
jgi:hypothetical protein